MTLFPRLLVASLWALPLGAFAQATAADAPVAQVSTLAGTCSGWTTVYKATDAKGKSEPSLLTNPTALAVGSRIYLYFADNGVRRIDLTTSKLTHVSGFNEGYAEGISSNAKYQFPTGVVADAQGNVYVADYGNHRIRRVVTSTGMVRTVAGSGTLGFNDGVGVSAQLAYPTGLVLDGRGTLYFTESAHHRIRKLVLATGAVTTLAGDTTGGYADGPLAKAKFKYPKGLAIDAQGFLYVADEGNHCIRKIDPATGMVSTAAGTGARGYADGPGGRALLSAPKGVAADHKGNLYITDAGNFRIRKLVLATGVVSTVAGNGQANFVDGPGPKAEFNTLGGVAVDGQGTVYVTDKTCIRQLNF